jgi:hypothetical protein
MGKRKNTSITKTSQQINAQIHHNKSMHKLLDSQPYQSIKHKCWGHSTQYVQDICQVRATDVWDFTNVTHFQRKTAIQKYKANSVQNSCTLPLKLGCNESA